MMDCKEFKKHIDDYFLDRDFNWKLRYEMDDHLVQCEHCQKIYSLSNLVTSEELTGEAIINVKVEIFIQKAKSLIERGRYNQALKWLNKALELEPENASINTRIKQLKEIHKLGRTEGLIKRSKFLSKILYGLKHQGSLKFRFINNLTRNGAPVLGTLKVGETDKNIYKMGTNINICIEMPPKRDGYLSVFHYNDKHNLEMIFPSKKTDSTFIKASLEKIIKIKVSKPLGKHYIKAIWSSKQLLIPNQIAFNNPVAVTFTMEDFLESILKLNNDEWMEFVEEFEVVEK
jgi:hypothetical protein